MAAEEITHSGRITSISPSGISVEFISESACSACHAKGLCPVGEGVRKTSEVPFVPGFETGEEVLVCLRSSMGHKAVWLAYMIPLALLVAVLLVLLGAGVSEPVSALCAIALVGVYYLVIRLFSDKLKKEYSFYIKKK